MILAEHLESATLGADLIMLDDIMKACSRSWADGDLSDCDALAVEEAVDRRRKALKADRPVLPPTPPKAARRHPVSPDRRASIERKRRVAASGSLPPHLAAGFTQGELSVLSIVTAEVRRSGQCAMFLDQIAALAGVSRSTAKNALRQAARLGLLSVTQRRRRGKLSDTNIIEILDASWLAWMRLRSKGQFADHHANKKESSLTKTPRSALPWGQPPRLEAGEGGFRAARSDS
jgi:hypothetical protein